MTGNAGAITKSLSSGLVWLVPLKEFGKAARWWAIECLVNSKQHFATPHGRQLFGKARVHEPHYIWPGLGLQMCPDACSKLEWLDGEKMRSSSGNVGKVGVAANGDHTC